MDSFIRSIQRIYTTEIFKKARVNILLILMKSKQQPYIKITCKIFFVQIIHRKSLHLGRSLGR